MLPLLSVSTSRSRSYASSTNHSRQSRSWCVHAYRRYPAPAGPSKWRLGALPIGVNDAHSAANRSTALTALVMGTPLAHRYPYRRPVGDRLGDLVPGIDVPDHAHTGIVGEHALDLLAGDRR